MWFEDFNILINKDENGNIIPLEERPRYIVFHGGRGGAKSWHGAIGSLQRGREERLRIMYVREIQRSIKDSVHKLLEDRINTYSLSDYKVNQSNIINNITQTEGIFLGLLRNASSVKSYEAIDIVVVEEAQAVSMESLDYLLPTIRKKHSQIWFFFNRFAEDDPVWIRICKNPSPDTYIRKINMMDLPKPFQSEVLIKEMQRDKIEDFDRYLHIWEGEPLGQDPQALLSRVEINKAMDRNIKPVGGLAIGADIARFGDDATVAYKRHGLKVIDQFIGKKMSNVMVANKLMDLADRNKEIPIKVDDTGLGGGVTDILKDNRYNVLPVNFGASGEAVSEEDKYVNVITEMWFNFKSILSDVQIPNDTELKSELGNRLFLYKPDERKMVERKEDYKKRHGKSPDKADALLLCYYQPKVKGAYVGQLDHDWVGGM